MLGRLIRVQRQRDPTDCAYCENPAATSLSLDRSTPEITAEKIQLSECEVSSSGTRVTGWLR